MRSRKLLRNLIGPCYLIGLTSCADLNDLSDGRAFWGKLPLYQEALVNKDAPTTQNSWNEETRKTSTLMIKSLKEKTKWKSRKNKTMKRAKEKSSGPQTAKVLKPPAAQPIGTAATNSQSASSEAQSLQLRLKSIWPEAPPSGAFSR
jgi:GTPase involved in cell partitioning and DNA repair